MENENLDRIITNLHASIQAWILRYRLRDGADEPAQFAKHVDDERNRVLTKLDGLDVGIDDVAEAKAAVNALADGEIARCKQVVEFDHLPGAIRSAGNSLGNAVGRIEQGRK
jgi:hypothetical protein